MKPETNEYALAKRARDGDRQALSELIGRLRKPLFGMAYAELRHYEDAQDAVAAALLRICQSINTLHQPERFRSWANSVARNETRRLVQQRVTVLPIEQADGIESGMTEVEALAMRIDIQEAFRHLPLVHTRALSLFYLGGQTITQIAVQTEHSEGTVKSWLHHGRKNLAYILQEYAPMTTVMSSAQPQEKTTRTAAMNAAMRQAVLIHSGLTPEIIRRVTNSLQARGYATHIPDAEEYDCLRRATETADFSVLDKWIAQFAVIALDEIVDGHSALEHVINLRSDPDWNDVLVYVLMSATPSSYTASAYFNAGVSGLIFKDQPDPNAPTLEFSDQRTVILWQKFTERARLTVLRAEEEAKRFGGNRIMPEHLLIGITRVPDCLAARLLSEQNGVVLETLRQTVEGKITRGTGYDPSRPMELTPRVTRAVGSAQEEAQALVHSWVGAEHLLLGILRENEGVAAQVLADLGLTLEKTREQLVDLLNR